MGANWYPTFKQDSYAMAKAGSDHNALLPSISLSLLILPIMPKTCAITQSNYIPWKGYFDHINMVDEFIIYDCVQYTKNDWRNRNKIKTDNGLQWLTIPITTPHGLKTRIDEAVASNLAWPKKHWSAIVCNYAKAKYFDLYESQLKDLYASIETINLSEINLKFLEYVCNSLSIKTRISSASRYELHEDRIMRLVQLCKQVGATVYLSGPRARAYLDVDVFAEHGITVQWMDYSSYPEYTQLFPPFEHAVSVLDLLLNEGPGCKQFMMSFDEAQVR